MKLFTGMLSLLVLSLMTVQAIAIPATPSGWLFQSVKVVFLMTSEQPISHSMGMPSVVFTLSKLKTL